MFKPVVASLALALSSASHADVLIDFEDLVIGSSPGSHYQAQYGITFSGGTVKEVNGSRVLAGAFMLSFAPPADLDRITLQGAQWADGNYWVTYASGFREPYYRDSTMDPHCYFTNCTQGGYTYDYIPPDQLFTYRFLNTKVDPITSISFITDLADNIRFVAPSWSQAAGDPVNVPLPGTLSLVVLGLVALSRQRRQVQDLGQ